MKKLSLILLIAIITCNLNAQTYTIISRSNDTIKMYHNALGASASALKSIIPGSKPEVPQYRLIKKIDQGKESLIFVDFTKILDKILVAYETDMVTPGEWQTTTISYADLYNAVTRRDAIYLSGEILGMKVEMFQRPPVIWEDLVRIDGIEFPLPIKLATYESELAQKAQKAAEKELLKIEKENKEGAEVIIMELAAMDENKAYIALLLKSQRVDTSHSSEIKKFFDSKEIQNLMQSFTVEQLEEKSKGHSKYFDNYSTY